MKIKILILILVFLLLANMAYARTGHIFLLSGYENNDSTIEGAIADLNLEIKPGKGRVFFQSFPLSQVDTQISTRFAQQFACDFVDVDCSNLDFFYTISSAGAIVGGPSAGSSMAVLTIAMLDNKEVRQDVAMTGTINSGGVIGPVGAVKEKIEVAKLNNFSYILVPKWATSKRNISLKLNNTVEPMINDKTSLIEEYIDFSSSKVIKVQDIAEALYYHTRKNYSTSEKILLPDKYAKTMDQFSDTLCEKTILLQEDANFYFDDYNYTSNYELVEKLYYELQENFTNETYDKYHDFSLRTNAYRQYNSSRIASSQGKSYSAASFCFVTNTLLREMQLLKFDNLTIEEINIDLENKITAFRDEVESREINSIIKLQTKQIVVERLIDSQEKLEKSKQESDLSLLAYSIERFYSAGIWYKFFDIDSKKRDIDQDTISNICRTKIMEAEERLGYIYTLLPYQLQDIQSLIKDAKTLYKEENPEMCIVFASQAKAKTDLLITSAYLYDDNLEEYFDDKFVLVEQKIAKEMLNGEFPIAALSYLEYASSLKDVDFSSSLLYLEYASELSNLGMYMNEGNKIDTIKFYLEDSYILTFSIALGFLFSGFIVLLLILGYIIYNRCNK
jgi:uncharacterized protein